MADEAFPASGSLPARVTARDDRLWRLAPVGVGFLSLVLGLIELTSQRRTYDERITVETATRSVGEIWQAARATEAPHLLYYLLIKPWLAAFGTGDWSARLPSVVFGALAAGVLTALGTRLFGRGAGLVAGLCLATASYALHFWQWARGYSLALLLTVLASYGFVRALESTRRRWVVLWGVSLVAACWVSLFSISVLAANVAAYLVKRPRPSPRLAALSAAAVCAAVAPIVVLVASADNGQLDWIPSPTLRRVAVQTWDWSSRNPFTLLAAAGGIALLVLAWRRRAPSWQLTFVVCWTVAPIVLTLALSAVRPAFDSHYLLTGAAGLALLVGAAVTGLPRRASLVLAALVLAWAGLELAHYYVAPGRPLSELF